MARYVLALAAALVSSSCSVAFQRSVRSSSVYCSDSRFWYLSDIVIGGGMTYVAATRTNDSRAYIPGAVFLGSSLIGIYKRHNCVRWQEKAPPEEWARMAAIAEAERQAAAQRQAEWEAAQRAAAEEAARLAALQPPPPEPSPEPAPIVRQPAPQPSPQPIASRPPPAPITVQIERHSATDEIGKSCTGGNDNGWPQAGTCQYGAVCYARRCTVWCGNDGSCPSGKTCAFTDSGVRTKLCR
jgi:hypothetical protein